ncbi:hypothetical protein D3C87_1240200 [compost metagenome]
MGHTALARELEAQAAAAHRHVAPVQRGQPIGAILPRVAQRADAHEGGVQQCDHSSEDLLARHAVARQVAGQPPTQARQRMPEGHQAGVLVGVAQRGPVRVIEVLLAAARIAARGLEMPSGIGADPYRLVGRRNRQGLDARERGLVIDPLALGIDVVKARARAAPRDPRLAVIGMAQPHGAQRRVDRLLGSLCGRRGDGRGAHVAPPTHKACQPIAASDAATYTAIAKNSGASGRNHTTCNRYKAIFAGRPGATCGSMAPTPQSPADRSRHRHRQPPRRSRCRPHRVPGRHRPAAGVAFAALP